MNIAGIAAVAHEVIGAYCLSLGDTSQTDWEHTPREQKESAVNGVKFHINNPEVAPDGEQKVKDYLFRQVVHSIIKHCL